MKSCLTKCAGLVLVALAMQGCSVDDKHIVTESQVVLPGIPTLERRIGDVDVIAVIDPQIARLTNKSGARMFIQKGWQEWHPNNENPGRVLCRIDIWKMKVFTQCQVDMSIKMDGAIVYMPVSGGSISVTDDDIGTAYIQDAILELIRIHAIDAASAGEAKLQDILN